MAFGLCESICSSVKWAALARQRFMRTPLWIREISLGSPGSQEKWEKCPENGSSGSVVTLSGSLSSLARVPLWLKPMGQPGSSLGGHSPYAYARYRLCFHLQRGRSSEDARNATWALHLCGLSAVYFWASCFPPWVSASLFIYLSLGRPHYTSSLSGRAW